MWGAFFAKIKINLINSTDDNKKPFAKLFKKAEICGILVNVRIYTPLSCIICGCGGI